MAVKRTSSTTIAPMTSLARRDSVGTDTGGRMATGGLLQFQTWPQATGRSEHGWDDDAGTGPGAATGRACGPTIPARSPSTTLPRPPGSRGGRAPTPGVTSSACGWRPTGPDVGERAERVVERGHLRQGEPGLR